METTTWFTTAKTVWAAASVAEGLERFELGAKLRAMVEQCEKGRERVEIELEPVELEFFQIVQETMATAICFCEPA